MENAFHQFVFSMISSGAATWSGAFADLARLEWRHLRNAPHGYILIPRHGVEQRIYVQPIVRLCALLVGTHLQAKEGQEPLLHQSILPEPKDLHSKGQYDGAEERAPTETIPENPPHEPGKRIALMRRQHSQWLLLLCQNAALKNNDDLPIWVGLQTLARISRAYTYEIHSPLIVATLTGTVRYAPIVDMQLDIFSRYKDERAETPPPKPSPRSLPSAPTKRSAAARGALRVSPLSSNTEKMIHALHEALSPLRSKTPSWRKELQTSLQTFSQTMEQSITTRSSPHPALPRLYEEFLQDERGSPEQVIAFNLLCIARFLESRIQNATLAPASLAAYRSDALAVVRMFPDKALNELNEEDALELLGTELAASTQRRLLHTFKDLAEFLASEQVSLEEIEWQALSVATALKPPWLLGQSGFESILHELRRLEEASVQNNQSDEAEQYRNVYFACLLGFYFGLRLSETVRLSVSDMILKARQPYLWVWRSKRGRSRRVRALHVPAPVLAVLEQERNQRFKASGDKGATFLRVRDDHQPTAKGISEVFRQGVERLGLRGSDESRPVVFHTLRHEFANRLLVLGVPLVIIARQMGHASPDTTTGSYLHAFDFLQRQQLEKYLATQSEPVAFDARILGAHLGLGRTAALALMDRYATTMGTPLAHIEAKALAAITQIGEGRSDRRLVVCSDLNRLLAFRLGLDDENGSSHNEICLCLSLLRSFAVFRRYHRSNSHRGQGIIPPMLCHLHFLEQLLVDHGGAGGRVPKKRLQTLGVTPPA